MKYVYTAIFTLDPGSDHQYNVTFPDLPGCNTFGDGLSEALRMAEDALCLWLYDKEEEKVAIPYATAPSKIKTTGDDFITAITADTEVYRRRHENRAVKKTLSIPMWLNKRAEEANVNFSQTLQKALIDELHINQ